MCIGQMENNCFRAKFVNERGATQVLQLNNKNLNPPFSDIIIEVKSCGIKKVIQEPSPIKKTITKKLKMNDHKAGMLGYFISVQSTCLIWMIKINFC